MNCLNGERFLPAALDSLKAQTFQDYEVIFWDNASKDGSAAIAHSFDPRLRYFSGRETVPLGQARNLALREAAGDYIAFLDCDDLWRPTKLEKQVKLLESNPAIGLVATDTEICRGSALLHQLFNQARPARGNVFEELMERQWIAMSSAMARKEAMDSIAMVRQAENGASCMEWFDEELNVCEEADLFYRIAHDWQVDYVDEPLTVWRIHDANTTFTKFSQFGAETRHILEKQRSLYPDYASKYPQLGERLLARADFQLAVGAWQKGEGARARELVAPHMSKSLKYKLFWVASFLPGSSFIPLAKLYFLLPGGLRKGF